MIQSSIVVKDACTVIDFDRIRDPMITVGKGGREMKKFFAIMLCAALVITTWCWDRKEIESRGYVLCIAIDGYPPFPKGQEEEKEYDEEKKLQHMPLDTNRTHSSIQQKLSYNTTLVIL